MHGPKASNDLKGPKTLDEWVEVYKRRVMEDNNFPMEPDEKLVWWPERGFFGYILDLQGKSVIITKICGDGRYMFHKIWEMAKALKQFGFKDFKYFSRRPPGAWLRILGGRLDKVEVRGGKPLYHFVVTLEDTKEGETRG